MKLSPPAFAALGLQKRGRCNDQQQRGASKRDRSARLDQLPSPLPGSEAPAPAGAGSLWKGKQRIIDEEEIAPSHVQNPSQWNLNGGSASTSCVTLDMVSSPADATLHRRAREDPFRDHPFSLKHNLPMLLLVIVGSIIVFATLVTNLAFLFRCCCGWNRKSRRRLKKNAWSPSMSGGTFASPGDEKASIALVPGKDGKEGAISMLTTPMPVLLADPSAAVDPSKRPSSHTSANGPEIEPVKGAMPSSDGRGWSLVDKPVAGASDANAAAPGSNNVQVHAMMLPPAHGVAAYAEATAGAKLGNGLPDLEGGRGLLPARRPSFIDRVLKQRGGATIYDYGTENGGGDYRAAALAGSNDGGENVGLQSNYCGSYPNVRALPGYGTSTPQLQPGSARPGAAGASRFAGMGVHASRIVLSMIPATLRNAASTSRARALVGGRYPANDSDFEGTIGGRDRDLPQAKRIGKKAERFAMEYSTEEEHSPEGFSNAAGLQGFGAVLGIPGGGRQGVVGTPGLAGIGAAWPSKRGEETAGLSRLIEMEEAAMLQQQQQLGAPNAYPQLPLPALDYQRALLEQRLQWEAYAMGQPVPEPRQLLQQQGHAFVIVQHQQQQIGRRERLLNTVSRWQEAARDAEPVYDPYTSAPPSVLGSLSDRPSHIKRHGSCRSATSGLSVSEVTSISDGSSVAGLLAFYQDKGAADAATLGAIGEEQVSRVPSIRPQFAATTTLSSWLDPGQVSTTHGTKSYEEECWEDVEGDEGRDHFASDVDADASRRSRSRSMLGYLNKTEAEEAMAAVAVVEKRKASRPRASRQASEESTQSRSSRSAAQARKVASKSSYSSTSVKRPAYDRHRSNASSSMHSARTRSSFRSSAALSTGASTNLSSLFDAEPVQSRRRADDKAAKKAARRGDRISAATAKEPRRERRRSRQVAGEARQVAAEEACASIDHEDDSSALSRADSSCLAPAAASGPTSRSRDLQLTRQGSSATLGSFYSELTAPEEYTFCAPLLASEAAAAMQMEREMEIKKKASKDSMTSDFSASVAAPPVKARKQTKQPKQQQQLEKRAAARKERLSETKEIGPVTKPESRPGPMPGRELVKEKRPVGEVPQSSASSRKVPGVRGESKPASHANEQPSSTLASRKEANGTTTRRPRQPSVPLPAQASEEEAPRRSSRPTVAEAGMQSATVTRVPSHVAAAVGQWEKRVKSQGSSNHNKAVVGARARNVVDHDESDSPLTSSDSDISLRRWRGATNSESVQPRRMRR